MPGSEEPSGTKFAPSGPRGVLVRFFAGLLDLSDVTDRSHHWIGAFCGQIIPGLKCFGRFRVECPFLGRKRPLLALVGVG